MKAVILAAGKGTRMEPLTCTRPKPMVPVCNRPFLTHVLDQLEGIVREAIIIIHTSDNKTPTLGTLYKSIALSYAVQQEQLGTGHALLCAKDSLDDRFLVLNGDCLVPAEDIRAVCVDETGLLVRHVQDLSAYGAVFQDRGHVAEIREKALSGPGLANVGVSVLTPDIFSSTPQLSPRGEYELTDMLNAYVQKHILAVTNAQTRHYSITHPWNLFAVTHYVLSQLTQSVIEGTIGGHVEVTGNIIVGQGTYISGHSYIEGPCIIGSDCVIGPFAHIRPYTTIGNDCRVNCEVKNSLFYDYAKSGHSSSHLLDSIVGEGANIGAGTITANLRHDGRNVFSDVKGNLLDTGLRKFGAIIGDNVHTGIGTAIRPGRKLWPGTTTLEHEVVKKDKH